MNAFRSETRLDKLCRFRRVVGAAMWTEEVSADVSICSAYEHRELIEKCGGLSCFRGTANTELWFLRMVISVTIHRSYRRISFWSNMNRWVGLWNIEIDTNTPRVLFFIFGVTAPQWASRASSFTRFLDHTQRRTTVGRTPLDEWSARRRYLYLITHNTHDRQTSMPPVGFEPTVSVGERPSYALDSAATGVGTPRLT